MSDLRAAAQQALEALENGKRVRDGEGGTKYQPPLEDSAIAALRDVLAQEEQEPVLVVEQEPDYMSRGHFYEGSKPFIDPTEVWKLPIGTKRYTQPPRREWRSLSEEEIRRMGIETPGQQGGWNLAFARAVEQALKEKNT